MGYYVTKASGNGKTGKMLVVTAPNSTCPNACPLKGSGCYAEYGPLGMLWRRVSECEPGETFKWGKSRPKAWSWEEVIEAINTHGNKLWRYGQAGDLPGDGDRLDAEKVNDLIEANNGRPNIAFTHYDMGDEHNRNLVKEANNKGFTVNLSANSLDHADELVRYNVGPVVTIAPADTKDKIVTKDGNTAVVCPHMTHGVTCEDCGLCSHAERKTIVMFPVHGTGKRKAGSLLAA